MNMQLINTMLAPINTVGHCPLCTGGAGAAAALAAFLGVKYGSIGVFMGAFAVALALWLPHKIKKTYIKYQNQILFWVIYLSTILPMYPLLQGDYVSKYISISGDFGSPLNKTYLIDLFIVGAIIGSIIVYIAPRISAFITKKRRDKTIPFQGIIITFSLLLVFAIILQVWPR